MNLASMLIDYQIYNFLLFALFKALGEVCQCFSSCNAEKQTLHLWFFNCLNGAGNEWNLNANFTCTGYMWMYSLLLTSFWVKSWSHSRQTVCLFSYEGQHPAVVSEFKNAVFHLFHSFLLTNNKALLLWDILLDIVKEKGHCSTSLIRQLKDSVFEAIDAFRTCGCYFHLLTFFKEVLDSTLCLIAHFDAGSVWQLERLQALVEIDKVSEVFLAEGLDHAIRVVFRNWDAVQFHLLGSKNVLVSVIHSLSSYLKIPMLVILKQQKL